MARTFEWMAIGDKGDFLIDVNRVVLQHYGDVGMRTRVLDKEDFDMGVKPWQIANLLNAAYEAGREHAMEDLRRFIGVK